MSQHRFTCWGQSNEITARASRTAGCHTCNIRGYTLTMGSVSRSQQMFLKSNERLRGNQVLQILPHIGATGASKNDISLYSKQQLWVFTSALKASGHFQREFQSHLYDQCFDAARRQRCNSGWDLASHLHEQGDRTQRKLVLQKCRRASGLEEFPFSKRRVIAAASAVAGQTDKAPFGNVDFNYCDLGRYKTCIWSLLQGAAPPTHRSFYY